jgi:hypothetical protein
MERFLTAPMLGAVLIAACAACATSPYEGSSAGSSARFSADADAASARADVGIFYNSLAPYGVWFWDADYGWAWTPSGLPPDWRPYTDGEWIFTDAGWCWQSDQVWGWAPFHYGRWSFRPARGWVWVPAAVWAPAWVAWRSGGGWVGWAPLPPQVGWRAGIGLETGGFDLDAGIEPYWWSFCDDAHFVGGRLRARIATLPRNVTLIRQTRSVTNLVIVDNRVVDSGLGVGGIERAMHKPVTRYRIVEMPGPGTRPQPPRGGVVRVYRPDVPDTRSQSPPERPSQAPSRPAAAAVVPGAIVPGAVRSGTVPPRNVPTATPQTPPPPPARDIPADIRRRQERERHDLGVRQQKQLRALEERHLRELAQPPTNASAQALREQHAAERRALEEQAARERELLGARHEAQQAQAARDAAAAAARGAAKGGKGRRAKGATPVDPSRPRDGSKR